MRKTPKDEDAIVIRGAREHNLKNITVRIPKNQLVVLTGVSGSGKSTLAFDTLFAEGQRRYVESLSSYARQFLGQMDKPKVDRITGLSPTIAIEQKAASNNPRSTVGTVTEIHDYLRVLYARVGQQHCSSCGALARAQSSDEMVRALVKSPEGTRVSILAPIFRERKGEHEGVLESASQKGFVRVRLDGKVVNLGEEKVNLDKKSKHSLDFIVDRIVIKPDARDRLTDAIETALRESGGSMVALFEGGEERFFSEKAACVKCGLSFDDLSPLAFSFNSPIGFCIECNGLGTRPEMDPDLVVTEPSKSIRGGAIPLWASAMGRGDGWIADSIEWVAEHFDIDLDKPWNKLSDRQRKAVLFGAKTRGAEWEGLTNQLMRRMRATSSEEMRVYYMKFFSQKQCPACRGTRLKPETRAVRIKDVGICDFADMTVDRAHAWIRDVKLTGEAAEIAVELRREIEQRLGFLRNVGLGYLTVSRAASTLSGGESQRIRLASQIGSELTGVVYVLDEPSIGLHQRDNAKLVATLVALREIGNTVVVVEHDEETVRAADYVIDFGPGAGKLGGHIVAEGTPETLARSKTSITGAYLSGRKRIDIPKTRRPGSGASIVVKNAREHNLKNVTARIPLGAFVAVTGVSGAGKSTLINRILLPSLQRQLHNATVPIGAHDGVTGLEHLDKVIAIDQRPIGRTPRSNPATYTKVFDSIRSLFASTREAKSFGYDQGRFSFNVKGGRCEACGGDGLRCVEMHFLPDVYVVCDTCHGKRFNDATLRVTYKDKNIHDVLRMPVREALEHFSVHRDITRGLRTLDEVGLGYIELGQSATTLSGGEAQRIKLARELSRPGTGRTLYVLDEPTTGLHFEDIARLLSVLERLLEKGNTILVIEHNLDVIKCADWVIDLGPEGGDAGGYIIAEGTPEEVARVKASHTGRYLGETLASQKPHGSVAETPRAKVKKTARENSANAE